MGTLFWLVVVGVVGWFVYKKLSAGNNAPSPAPQAQGSPPTPPAPPPPQPTGGTASLSDLNLVYLRSMREEPGDNTLGAKFPLPSDAVKSGVIYTCVQSSSQLWTHTWLFEQERPDLFEHEPVAEVVVGSSGHVSLNMGFPSNYRSVVMTLQKQNLL